MKSDNKMSSIRKSSLSPTSTPKAGPYNRNKAVVDTLNKNVASRKTEMTTCYAETTNKSKKLSQAREDPGKIYTLN
jgi:hypothetical protein